MNRGFRYYLNELKAAVALALAPTLVVSWLCIAVSWISLGAYLKLVCGVFALFFAIFVLAGLHDDYKVSIRIERKRK